MKPWSRIFLYVAALPTTLLGWLVVLFVRAVWGEDLRWHQGALVAEFRPDSWPVRTWYARWGGSTIGHSIVLNGSLSTEQLDHVLEHEHVHVEQHEAAGVAGVVLALAIVWVSWWLALIVWALMPGLLYLCAGLAALARGESFYRGNHLEEGAFDRAERRG